MIEYYLAIWILRGGVAYMPDRYDAVQCEAARAAVEAQFKPTRSGYGAPAGGAVCVPRPIAGLR